MSGSKFRFRLFFYLLQRRKRFKTPQKRSKTFKVKGKIYFDTSKFHHKLRAKRKKDREKEVFTLGNVLEACVNGKNSEISRNLLKKVELRSGHSVVNEKIEGVRSSLLCDMIGLLQVC